MSMSQPIEIKNNHGDTVGHINFNVEPNYLSATRTGAGFSLSLPAELSLNLVGEKDPKPMVSNIWGVLFTSAASGKNAEVGRLQYESWDSGGWSKEPGKSVPRDIRLTWRGTFAELAVFEKLREGRPPQIQIQLWGELCYLLESNHPHLQVRTHPQRFHGDVTVKYPKEIWVQRLQSLGVLENVLVEVPLPKSPPAPWDGVWGSLVAARNHFEQGGTTGWGGTVLAVRQALEKWRDIETPNTGSPDPKKRSKRERLDNLRLALHQCTHVWIHKDDECSRDDALLMLSTLSALLAERKP